MNACVLRMYVISVYCIQIVYPTSTLDAWVYVEEISLKFDARPWLDEGLKKVGEHQDCRILINSN